MRVGIGYDVHPLAPKRRLVLGGVEVPYEQGLMGFSDADVLIHAIIDALLGAAVLGDIGKHFPPEDERYRDISSLLLAQRVAQMLADTGWRVCNVDATVVAERPRLAGYVDTMRSRVAESLGVSMEQISIKAKTTEGLGFTGRGEGIAAYAVALIERA